MNFKLPSSLGFIVSAARPFSNPRSYVVTARTQNLPPSGPGCSRWFSCTCCRKNAVKVPLSAQSTTAKNLSTPASRIPHLPLPPPLPYSPTSVPFLRHLQVLDLALLSSPQESWDVFKALHASLRRYIPDHTFRNLIAHQITSDSAMHPSGRWNRLETLLRIARRYEMALGEIGRENVEEAFRCGLERFSNAAFVRETNKTNNYTIINWLWRSVKEVRGGELSQIPLDIRISWIRFQCLRDRIVKNLSCHFTYQAIKEIITGKGGQDLDEVINESLNCLVPTGWPAGIEDMIRQIIWCLEKDVKVSPDTTTRVMRKLRNAYDQEGKERNDGGWRLQTFVRDMIRQAEITGAPIIAHHLEASLEEAIRQTRSLSERIGEELKNDCSGLSLLRTGYETIQSLPTERDPLKTLDSLIELCETVIRKRDGNVGAFITLLYNTLRQRQDLDKTGHLVTSFAQMLVRTSSLSSVKSAIIIHLYNTLIRLPESSETYLLIRRIHPLVRTTAVSPYKWSQMNRHLWRKLFKQAINSTKLHLHFASRLYAELQADGLTIRRTDALALIRAISMSTSPSRAVLLERHLKDWRWFDYADIEIVCKALSEGLVSTKDPDDTILALNLIKRLLQGRQISTDILRFSLPVLSRSKNPIHQAKCLDILDSLHNRLDLVKRYNDILYNLITSPSSASSYDENLSRGIQIYKSLLTRNISPNTRTFSLLIRGLLESGRPDSALLAFRAALDSGIILKSNVVGRLMVNLIMADRLDDAAIVEKQWREVGKSITPGLKLQNVWDKAVVGARVLLDLKKGVEVDLKKVERRTGWKPNAHFYAFLKGFTPQKEVGSQVPEIEKENIQSVVAVAEKGPGGEIDTQRYNLKRRITPLTRSFWGDGVNSQNWLTDVSDHKDVDGRGVNLEGRVGMVMV